MPAVVRSSCAALELMQAGLQQLKPFCLAAAVDTLAHVEAKLPGPGADRRPMSSALGPRGLQLKDAWQLSTT